jgi:flagellar protein FliL
VGFVPAALVAPFLDAVAAEEHGAGPGPAMPGGPPFVKLPMFSIPVIEGDKVTRQVAVYIVLELSEGQSAATLQPKERQLMDAFLRDLYGMFAQRSGADRIAIQGSIKTRLSLTADKVLGPGIVKQVLILQLYERNLPH